MVGIYPLSKINLIGGLAAGGGGSAPPGDLEDTYATNFANAGFETGDFTSWTDTGNNAVKVAADITGVSAVHAGTYAAQGSQTLAASQIEQRLAVPATLLTAVDAGNGRMIIRHFASATDDRGYPFVQFYDFDGTAVGSEVTGNLLYPRQAEEWIRREFSFDVPVNARSAAVGFKFVREAGTIINYQVDSTDVEWFNKATDNKVALSKMRYSWNGAPGGLTDTRTINFDLAGDYLLLICGSSGDTDTASIPTISGTVTTSGDVTYTQIGSAEIPGGYDFVIAARVNVAVAGEYTVTTTADNTALYRVGMVSYFAQNVDWASVDFFHVDPPPDANTTYSFTPAAGSAGAALMFHRLAYADGDLSNLEREGGIDFGSLFFASSFSKTDFPNTEQTIVDANSTARAITGGVIMPPA